MFGTALPRVAHRMFTLSGIAHSTSVLSRTLVRAKDEHGNIRTRRDRYGFLGTPEPHDAVFQLPLRRHADTPTASSSAVAAVGELVPVFANVGFRGGP